MPSPVPRHDVKTYRSARELPTEVWAAFHGNPRASNIMLPYAKKARQMPDLYTEHPSGNLWIACTTTESGYIIPSVDFILSCTEGPLGSYPIFIFTPIAATQLDAAHYIPRLRSLVNALQQVVPPERVFSVFALDTITRAFADLWTKATGITLEHEHDPEYYSAKLTYCTSDTFRRRQLTSPLDMVYDLRLARADEARQVAELCSGFATTSEPFTLSARRAMAEAALLIRAGQIWVHEVRAPGQRPEIASIVAVTRTSDTVAGITKVYTNPRWRQRGCAERLVRHVCQQLLRTKESVVLYVAHSNPAAAKVYHRVGFVGLSCDSQEAEEGVESWLELGFDRTRTDLGHW